MKPPEEFRPVLERYERLFTLALRVLGMSEKKLKRRADRNFD
jgi:hypothetical protein